MNMPNRGCRLNLETKESSTSIISFLGIELDTVALDVRLALGKLENCKQAALASWSGRRSATKREIFLDWSLAMDAKKSEREGLS